MLWMKKLYITYGQRGSVSGGMTSMAAITQLLLGIATGDGA